MECVPHAQDNLLMTEANVHVQLEAPELEQNVNNYVHLTNLLMKMDYVIPAQFTRLFQMENVSVKKTILETIQLVNVNSYVHQTNFNIKEDALNAH